MKFSDPRIKSIIKFRIHFRRFEAENKLKNTKNWLITFFFSCIRYNIENIYSSIFLFPFFLKRTKDIHFLIYEVYFVKLKFRFINIDVYLLKAHFQILIVEFQMWLNTILIFWRLIFSSWLLNFIYLRLIFTPGK